MQDWRAIVESAEDIFSLKEELIKGTIDGIYEKSVFITDDTLFFMIHDGLNKVLVVIGTEQSLLAFSGKQERVGRLNILLGDLNQENAQAMRERFSWMAPQALGSSGVSLGLGDRLGLASPGHIASLHSSSIRPILAQQSMRELELTKRSYRDVLDAASWAVFQEGYTKGFGSDGDHLKKVVDIQGALDLGFSMITLDCSEHIDDSVRHLSKQEIMLAYEKLSSEVRSIYENLYKESKNSLDFAAKKTSIEIDSEHYYRMILTYAQAIDFIEEVYTTVITKVDRPIDFEISIDEVETPTTPQDHFFVANELNRRGIRTSGVAPRFCGSFEKGIDYIGDLEKFEAEFIIHAQIAEHFGYKLSIHSGSDKFSVFPIIGKHAKSYHVKTAGTNWLEALRVIADVEPNLYRKIHAKSLATLDLARKYYMVSLDLKAIPNYQKVADQDLTNFLNHDDARQLLHITYGFVLQDSELREGIYAVLSKYEDKYKDYLRTHIGRHIQTLGL